jgi:hypothetical protein
MVLARMASAARVDQSARRWRSPGSGGVNWLGSFAGARSAMLAASYSRVRPEPPAADQQDMVTSRKRRRGLVAQVSGVLEDWLSGWWAVVWVSGSFSCSPAARLSDLPTLPPASAPAQRGRRTVLACRGQVEVSLAASSVLVNRRRGAALFRTLLWPAFWFLADTAAGATQMTRNGSR